MTFDELIIYEPRLLPLITACNEASVISSMTVKDRIWYRVIKPEMSKLVGWGSEDERLQSPAIYDLTYKTLTGLMGV